MRKFSKYSKSPVGEEPKQIKKINEEDILKVRILNLMDQFLRVQTYGPVNRYQVAGLMKVSGKEIFLEALIDLMKNNESDRDVKILESLKSEVLDWKVIDSKIDQIRSKNNDLYSQRLRLRSLCEMYRDDEEVLMEMIRLSSDKISDNERSLRVIACDDLKEIDQNIINKIKDIYNSKY